MFLPPVESWGGSDTILCSCFITCIPEAPWIINLYPKLSAQDTAEFPESKLLGWLAEIREMFGALRGEGGAAGIPCPIVRNSSRQGTQQH